MKFIYMILVSSLICGQACALEEKPISSNITKIWGCSKCR